jgi:hypothetical protein
VSAATQRSVMTPGTPSEDTVPLEELSVAPQFYEITSDNHSISDGDSQVTENVQPSCQSWVSHQNEGVTNVEPTVTAGTSQRGQICTMSQRMAESVAQGMHYMAHQSTIDETNEDLFHDAQLELQERMQNPIVFHAEMMGDIVYLQQALRQHDAKEFVQAVVKEVNRHVDCKNCFLKKRSKVPEDIQIVTSVWSMGRKRDLTMNKIKSPKTRLNLHGGKQIYGMNYFETYAPVVTWFTIRLMIIFGIIFCWALHQVDFVMAYPQAPIKMDMYMELPQGIQTMHGNSKDHMLKLEKNIYGQKQAGRVWNSFLMDKLLSIGFTSSLIDDCVFFCDDIIFMVYVGDGIFLGNNDSKLQETIKDIQDLGLNIEDQGHPADYVGVNIKKLQDGSYEFTQHALIDSIINDIKLKDAKVKPVPAKVSLQLHKFKDEPPFNLDFNYRSAVGKLNHKPQDLTVCTRHTKLLSSCQIQDSHMARLSFI